MFGVEPEARKPCDFEASVEIKSDKVLLDIAKLEMLSKELDLKKAEAEEIYAACFMLRFTLFRELGREYPDIKTSERPHVRIIGLESENAIYYVAET